MSRSRSLVPATRRLPDAPRTTQVHLPDETPALARMAFEEIAHAVGGIGAVHSAVADRAFGASGPAATPARIVHDAISAGVYAGLRGGARLAGVGAEQVLRQRRRVERPLSTTHGGATLIGIVNGLVGDHLEREGHPLHHPMTVRADGHPIALTPSALRRAFPAPRRRIVVFLHGLMETEFAWGGDDAYGPRLERDLGCTAVFVRYNTGLRISANGRSLAELLAALVAAWPVPVEEIALIGHSMGGLVARSACHQASAGEAPWIPHVRHIVSLGTPHTGAPLEQVVHAASAALHALPETRPLGRFLRRRSGGIRDLHQGSLVDEDWLDRDPDALRAAACQEVPLLDGVTHCFVSATITRDPRHPLGRLIGDWLVLQSSASGRGRSRRIPFDERYGHHIGGATHMALLKHPAVYEKLLEWLSEPAGSATGPAGTPRGRTSRARTALRR